MTPTPSPAFVATCVVAGLVMLASWLAYYLNPPPPPPGDCLTT